MYAFSVGNYGVFKRLSTINVLTYLLISYFGQTLIISMYIRYCTVIDNDGDLKLFTTSAVYFHEIGNYFYSVAQSASMVTTDLRRIIHINDDILVPCGRYNSIAILCRPNKYACGFLHTAERRVVY